jgi:hypothetical protein
MNGYGGYRKCWSSASVVLLLALVVAGCESKGGTGALAGAGVGALIGQAAGGNTQATLIGAGIGAGVGYIVGNEMDKADAKKHSANPTYKPQKSPLTGTTWQVVSVVPEPDPPFKSMTVHFGIDGYANTNKVFEGGRLEKGRERYRVVGKTLVVNNPGYLINAEYAIDGDQLIIDCEKFRGVLQRVGK